MPIPWREWLGDLAPGSLLILDEAHHAAPSSGGRYGIETKFTRAIRDLGGRFEHRLFLSATPHNGHSNSFATLLELLDPYRFTRGVPVRGKNALEDVMVRRIKEDIREVQGGFPKREVCRVVIDGLPDDAPELVLSRLLDEYRSLREKRFEGVPARTRAAAGLLVVGLQQKLLSSIEAFAISLARHRKTGPRAVGALRIRQWPGHGRRPRCIRVPGRIPVRDAPGRRRRSRGAHGRGERVGRGSADRGRQCRYRKRSAQHSGYRGAVGGRTGPARPDGTRGIRRARPA